MKYRCYECKDDRGITVAKACDKKAEEIKTMETSNNWNCTILPD